MSSKVSSVASSLESVERYSDLELAVFRSLANTPTGTPFFTTDANEDALWNAYLDNINRSRRQYYTCHCCRHFIQRYGGLVVIDAKGVQRPVLWNLQDPPPFFTPAVESLYEIAAKAKVTGVFLSSDKILGNPLTTTKGEWSHLAAQNPNVYAGKLLTASQAMAEKVEDYKMLCHALSDYSRETVEQAVRVLKSDAIYRGEKTLGVAEWFLTLHSYVRDFPKHKRNLTWLVVAKAPPGFCHIRSTMIATLLDDINNGLPFEVVANKWKEKMHPLQYQRPTAPPKAGAIDEAEKVFAKLGLERSLLRRYATLDDVQVKFWVPQPMPVDFKKLGTGVFDHLRRPKELQQGLELPAVTMTWEKFKRTVLDTVYEMEICVPERGGFCGLLTAEDPEAPPILQWDGLTKHPRNPVSHYFYLRGSSARQWGLMPGWNKVTCIFPSEFKWQKPDGFKHQEERIHFAIEGCRDSQPNSLGLFPECLKAELRGVRSVIEAHSNSRGASGAEFGTANGLTLDNKNAVTIRVRTAEGYASYHLDRLD